MSRQNLFDSYKSVRHFGSLDGLRFICITAVLWHHFPIWQRLGDLTILARGHTGVDFFFVLSGFLITTLLLREEERDGRFSLKGFYWRRALRILPVYLFSVALVAAFFIGIEGQTEYLHLLPFYFLFLSNFMVEHLPLLEPTWSLAVEEQYYLIWPLLLLLVPRAWIAPLLLALITINVAGVLGVFTPFGIVGFRVGESLFFNLNGTTYAPILMGSLAAILLNRRAWFDRMATFLSAKAAPWVCFAGLILALWFLPTTLEGFPNLLVHSLMTLMLISLVVREDNGMARIMKLRPIIRIGQVSYGVYLYHLLSLSVLGKLLNPLFYRFEWPIMTLLFVLYYGLAFLLAEISFRTFESWFLKFRHPRAPKSAAGAQDQKKVV